MSFPFSNSLKTDQRLFRVEIRASIAHCNGLFRAGILTRLESERLKNALWTILKRADFDHDFLEQSNSPDVFAFIEARLHQLVNDACAKLEIGRSRAARAAVALRLYLRDEMEIFIEMLEDFHHDLSRAAQKSHLLIVFSDNFDRDSERLREILRRTNQMPRPPLNSFDDATSELDFAEIAHELRFDKVLENSGGGVFDRDFCVEFVNSAALIMLHLTDLGNAIIAHKLESNDSKRRVLEMMRGKCSKIFGLHAALLSLLKSLPADPVNDLDEVGEIVFESIDILKASLQTKTAVVRELL